MPSLTQLIDAGLASAVFSLQGATRATHERVTRVPGSFERTIMNIQQYVKAGLWVGLHFVPLRSNYRDARTMTDLAADLGVDELAFLRFVPQGRGVTNRPELELSHGEFQWLLRELSSMAASETRLIIRVGCPLSFSAAGLESKECKAGLTTALVDPFGRMHACSAFKNLPGTDTPDLGPDWNVAWHSCQRRGVGEVTAEGLSGACAVCKNLAECRGRCAAQRYLAHGSIMVGPDPMCPRDGAGGCAARVERRWAVSAGRSREMQAQQHAHRPSEGNTLVGQATTGHNYRARPRRPGCPVVSRH